MGMKMLVVFSHVLTDEQIADAKQSLHVDDFIYMPEDLQRIWSNIDPTLYDVTDVIKTIRQWVLDNSSVGTPVLIQGDMGATYNLVNFCMSHWLVPVYATTNRVSIEQKMPDGSIQKSSVFKHVIFRKYM